ncbi:MAG: hypothetical protein US81_C0007G0008 [Parcubacteria group bacterium GW2011_GWE2_38_18]|nr:MAG: hypothetical protein US81_C0007G0008 [Parcubacteria group bacterium GW2011_GWE2_38_18]
MKRINQKGVALILSMITMSLILFLMMYFLNFTATETKISKSQTFSTKTYYLAEAGINEMIWKIKNDANYKNDFESNPNWETSFTRTNPFGVNSGSYEVSIKNTSQAHGEIISKASFIVNGNKTSQRIIKTSIYKAMGQSGIGNNAGYSDGNIEITNSTVNYQGGAHSNNVFNIKNNSTVNIAGNLQAVGNFLTSGAISTINISSSTYASNFPLGPATPIDMPAIDFNSASSTSFKNLAVNVYTANQFEGLLEDNENLILNQGITYVVGNTEISKAESLTIPGALVVEGDLAIDDDSVNINVTHVPGQPSGLLATNKIDFDGEVGNVSIEGIIYAANLVNIKNIDNGGIFNVTGGIVGRKLTIEGVARTVNIIHDNQILIDVLKATEFSPVILVDHWEEEY